MKCGKPDFTGKNMETHINDPDSTEKRIEVEIFVTLSLPWITL
jgi:hypothetical protein